MKVIRSKEVIGPITKGSTVVGQIYTHMDCDDTAYFRVQGGFANLCTGQFIDYPNVKDNGWVHEPDAVLDLTPRNA